MLITEQFKKVLYGLFISSLTFQSLQILITTSWNSNITYFFEISIRIALSFCLWYGISFITNKQRLCLIAFLIQNLVNFYYLFLLLFAIDTTYDNVYSFELLTKLCVPVVSFSYFGYIYFNNIKGLWIGIIGLFIGFNVLVFSSLIFHLFNLLNVEFLFFYDSSIYHYLSIFTVTFYFPLLFIIFWFLINLIKQKNFNSLIFLLRRFTPHIAMIKS